MNIVRIRYFLAVCRHGSFTAAARACGVSQPSVTTGVRRLERALGGSLFERRHPVRLTALGTKLRPLLEELQSAVDRVTTVVEARKGTAARAGAPAGVVGLPGEAANGGAPAPSSVNHEHAAPVRPAEPASRRFEPAGTAGRDDIIVTSSSARGRRSNGPTSRPNIITK